MDPVLRLSPDRVEVAPGDEIAIQVLVRNPGDLVVEYDLTVLGAAARWTEVRRPTFSLLHADAGPEHAEATIDVIFRPPRPPAAPAGEIPFGIRCVSHEDPDQATVEEGVVVVSAVQGLEASLDPVGRSGRRAGRFGLTLRNTGTTALQVSVRVSDSAERLRFAVGPDTLRIESGESGVAYIAVAPLQQVWLGRAVEHSFTVAHQVVGAPGVDTRPATWLQRPVIPRWLVVLALVVVVVLVLLLAWLFWSAPDDPVEVVRGGEPPPVAAVSAVSEAGGTAVVTWTPSPYSVSGYRVRTVDEAAGTALDNRVVDDPEQGSLEWPGLAAGRACFEVVALGYDDEAGVPQERSCVEVLAPEVVASGAAPSDSATAVVAATAAPAGPATAAAPTTTAPAVPGGAPSAQEDLRGWFVVYASEYVADTAVQSDALTVLTVSLQNAGAAAQLVDGSDYARLRSVQVYVVEDGFADRDAASRQCEAQRLVAPLCIVGPAPAGL